MTQSPLTILRARLPLGLAASAAAIATAAVLASIGSAQSKPTTMHLPSSSTEHFVARFIGVTSGNPNNPRPGGTLTAHSNIYDGSGKHRLGRDSEVCTITTLKPFTMQCVYTVILPGGNFIVENAFNPDGAQVHIGARRGHGEVRRRARRVLRPGSGGASGALDDHVHEELAP
jgi:hypothetical protein